jgi:hypothetical protein
MQYPPGLLSALIGSQATKLHACNCVGPQDGQPLCPCRMSSVRIVDGRYVEVIDHGPAPITPPTERQP